VRADPQSFIPKSPKGLLVLEGINGCGKSTLQKHLSEFLNSRGHETFLTRQPGGSPTGEAIRSILRGSQSPKSSLSELFLFAADRAEHTQITIPEALSRKVIVLCDRFAYSTAAFQGYGRSLDLELVNRVNQLAVGGCWPDCIILLDLDPEVALRRAAGRTDDEAGIDVFEQEELSFHQAVRDGFLKIAESVDEPFFVLNAEDSPDKLMDQLTPFRERYLTCLPENPDERP